MMKGGSDLTRRWRLEIGDAMGMGMGMGNEGWSLWSMGKVGSYLVPV